MEQRTNLDLRKDFETYWLKVLEPALREKEKLRKKYVSRFWWILFSLIAVFVIIPILTFALAALYAFLYLSSHPGVTEYHYQGGITLNPFVTSMIVAGIIFILRAPYHQYKSKIKQDIMPLFIGYFDSFTYALGKGLSEDEIEDSGIFPNFDEHQSDDCFEGCFEGVNIHVTEERLSAYHHTKRGSRKVEVFKGIAVRLDLNKNFTSKTIVLKDAGIFNRFQSFSRPERIKLEDVHFEKLFEVYGTDQIEARRLLTPAFMERIIRLKDLYKGKSVQFSFWAGKLLIAISTNQDMFEPFSFFFTNINKDKIDTVFEQFLTIFEIIHILKISTQNA